MDSEQIASTTNQFIGSVTDLAVENLPIVLTFSAGILVWVIMKKWVFGGAGRI